MAQELQHEEADGRVDAAGLGLDLGVELLHVLHREQVPDHAALRVDGDVFHLTLAKREPLKNFSELCHVLVDVEGDEAHDEHRNGHVLGDEAGALEPVRDEEDEVDDAQVGGDRALVRADVFRLGLGLEHDFGGDHHEGSAHAQHEDEGGGEAELVFYLAARGRGGW